LSEARRPSTPEDVPSDELPPEADAASIDKMGVLRAMLAP
jgi:hypothetical protein